jgi:hypothetical protein
MQDSILLKRASERLGNGCSTPISKKYLLEVSKREGLAFSTALLYQSLIQSKQNKTFFNSINEIQKSTENRISCKKPLVVIIPGLYYKEYAKSGADGSFVKKAAKNLGYRIQTIDTLSTGTVAENSMIISKWLEECAEEEIVLFSMSKGGIEVKNIICNSSQVSSLDNVVAWVNVVGTLDGTPIGKYLKTNFLFKSFMTIKNLQTKFIRDFDWSPAENINQENFSLPSHMKMISVVGFPTRRHLLKFSITRRFYKILSSYGPNDGYMPLYNIQNWPGFIYPVWGADHFLRPYCEIEHLFESFLYYVSNHKSIL